MTNNTHTHTHKQMHKVRPEGAKAVANMRVMTAPAVRCW